MRRILAVLMLAAGLLTTAAVSVPAQASVNYGGAALNWAEAHETGLWYAWGGAGPSTYDCSGAVMAAFAHVGISLPHSTYMMMASGHLHWIPLNQARRGDLLFFGSGHVEFDTIWYHVSFGAHHSGTTVGWRSYDPRYWAPTMAFRVW
jgi:cell wall-associated NlpC family hydrolase